MSCVEAGDLLGVQDCLCDLHKNGEIISDAVTSREFGRRGSRTSLHVAATRGHADILEFLLATKADPNVQDEAGTTPLHFAAEMGNARVARVLLAAGADASLKNGFGRMAADKLEAKSWDSPKVVKGKLDIQRLLESLSEDVPPQSPLRKRSPYSSEPFRHMSPTRRGGA